MSYTKPTTAADLRALTEAAIRKREREITFADAVERCEKWAREGRDYACIVDWDRERREYLTNDTRALLKSRGFRLEDSGRDVWAHWDGMSVWHRFWAVLLYKD